MGKRDFTSYVRDSFAALIHRAETVLLALLSVMSATVFAQASGVYQEPSEFLMESLDNPMPEGRRPWITKPMLAEIRTRLAHELGQGRIQHWQKAEGTARILEAMGNERPFTTGLVADPGQLGILRMPIYRKSRRLEVRRRASIDQFNGTSRAVPFLLDRHTDAVSDATMSLRALTHQAQLAMQLQRHAHT
ncbi:MAG: hypothetical protein ACI915_002178 [Gammaproteobacteria bacterium]|jgi:hypothetical protein